MVHEKKISNKVLTELISVKNFIDAIWLLAFIAIIFFYIGLSYIANTDLTAGRFVLFMDERITFDGVRHILHPSSIEDFIMSVIHGGDHRYGRSLWYSIALFSFIPEHFFRESGQIIADRMAQVFILLSSYCLFAISFLRSWFMRFVLMVVLLAMPYTAYYMSMPKPEPLQILFIAIFLNFYKKEQFSLKSPYWAFLGFAFGTKISTLPIIPVFILFGYINYIEQKDISKYFKDILSVLFWLLVGLAFAEPILAGHIFISFLLYFITIKYIPNNLRHVQTNYAVIIFIGALNLLVGAALYKAGLNANLAFWGGSTFLNTAHGTDRPDIWLGSWVMYFISDWMVAPQLMVICLILILIIYMVLSLKYCLKDIANFSGVNNIFSIAIILSGVMLNLSVMIMTHRLWGLYLFPGMILITVGLLSVLELNIANTDNNILNNLEKMRLYLARISLSVALLIVCVWWLPKSISDFKALANRTRSDIYITQYSSYIKITEFLAKYAKTKDKTLKVLADPKLFLPESNNHYEIKEFFGPFIQWGDRPDVILFSSAHTAKRKLIPMNATVYKSFILECDGYGMFVAHDNEKCSNALCYRKSADLPGGGEILTLVTQ
jgi:hypothetical protein